MYVYGYMDFLEIPCAMDRTLPEIEALLSFNFFSDRLSELDGFGVIAAVYSPNTNANTSVVIANRR